MRSQNVTLPFEQPHDWQPLKYVVAVGSAHGSHCPLLELGVVTPLAVVDAGVVLAGVALAGVVPYEPDAPERVVQFFIDG